MDEKKLVLADLFRAEMVRRFTEVLTEFVDVIRVGIDRGGSEVSQLHVFGHALNERIESFLVRRHGWPFRALGGGQEDSHEHQPARPLGDHSATRVRYSRVARMIALRKRFRANYE